MTKDIWGEFNEELLGFIKARINDSETAKDILQDVFLKIHRDVNTIKDNEKLTSWIYQITRNTIIDFYRKRKIDTKEYEFEKLLPVEIDDSTFDFTKCLKPFISKLPDKYKDILLKTTYGNISQKEYSERHSLSYSAAKSRVQRARQKLKESFIKCCAIQTDQFGNIISSKNKQCDC